MSEVARLAGRTLVLALLVGCDDGTLYDFEVKNPSVNDWSGDADGTRDPGETFAFQADVENASATDYTNVVATVVPTTSCVTMTEGADQVNVGSVPGLDVYASDYGGSSNEFYTFTLYGLQGTWNDDCLGLNELVFRVEFGTDQGSQLGKIVLRR
jgi:hypothetical protein